MNGTSLNLNGEIVDSVDYDRTEDEDGAEDDTYNDDIGEIGPLAGS